jgi:hypothetical protein
METTGYQKTNSLSILFKPLFYLVALLAATYAVLKVEKLKPSDFGDYQKIFNKEMIIQRSDYYPLRRHTAVLNSEEMMYAKIAWKYFENNYNERTGLVSGIEGKDAASLNDISSYMMGMMSAYELGVIDSTVFDTRMTTLLSSLAKLPLYEGKLPNKLYSTETLEMLGDNYKPSEQGIGWSGLQVGRFFNVVKKVENSYPAYACMVKKVTSRWKTNELVADGYLHGIVRTPDNTLHNVQEGTLGYEEYCSKGLMMSGYDLSEAMQYTDFTKLVKINERELPVDTRGTDYSAVPNYLTTDPFILDGLEFGWDLTSREISYRLYKIQEDRYKETGIVTAAGEDPIDKKPYYAFNSVYAAGEEWSCLDEEGNNIDDLRCISTKTAFAWHSLYNDSYADLAYLSVKSLNDPAKGWYAGKYEKGEANKSLTAVTNGTVLEALNYKINGRIIKM